MRVSLLRHAPTAENLASRYVGRTDPPLAPEGVALASGVGPDDSARVVYTSPLKRTVETARILYPAARIVPVADLAEMDFGVFENQTHAELMRTDEYRRWLDSQCESPCPGGESRVEFAARSAAAFAAVFSEADPTDTLRLVVHGGVIMAVMDAFALERRDFFAWKAGHCGGYLLESDTPHDGRFLRLVETQ